MGYRDDLIQRLKDEGLWDAMTDEQRQVYERINDERAGRLMSTLDWLAIGDSETTRKVGVGLLNEAFGVLLGTFQGALLELDGERAGTLSRAGILLSEFVAELMDRGLDEGTIATEFPKLDNIALLIVLRAYHKTQNEQS